MAILEKSDVSLSAPPADSLAQRLRVFTDAGWISEIPTDWQVFQAALAMAPYVISPDATNEPRYAGAVLGHPILRQPIIAAEVGLDHFRIGTGLGARLRSVCRHLHFTFHGGMPVWDLQIVQTHEGGLDELRRSTEELLAEKTPLARRQAARLRWILPRHEEYLQAFLGDAGYIARAERLDYPSAEEAGSALPPEFFSLVNFMRHAARAYPQQPGDLPATRLPAHLLELALRRPKRVLQNHMISLSHFLRRRP